jgi:hypothetical protein
VAARVAFAAAAVLYAVVVAAGARSLPARVPMHFGAGGTPDRFGSRTELLVTEIALGVGVVVLLGAVAVGMRRVSLAWVNVPHPEYWKAPAHEAELRRRLEADTLGIGTATLLLLAGMSALTARAASSGDGLGPAAGVLVGAYVLGVLGYCGWMVVGRYRPPTSSADDAPDRRGGGLTGVPRG